MTGKSDMAVSLFTNPFEHKGAINWKGYDDEVNDEEPGNGRNGFFYRASKRPKSLERKAAQHAHNEEQLLGSGSFLNYSM
jgi:hypothetical protein